MAQSPPGCGLQGVSVIHLMVAVDWEGLSDIRLATYPCLESPADWPAALKVRVPGTVKKGLVSCETCTVAELAETAVIRKRSPYTTCGTLSVSVASCVIAAVQGDEALGHEYPVTTVTCATFPESELRVKTGAVPKLELDRTAVCPDASVTEPGIVMETVPLEEPPTVIVTMAGVVLHEGLPLHDGVNFIV